MTNTMRYIKHLAKGAPETLKVDQIEIPTLTTGQVMVKVTCFGVNRADTLQRQGKYPPPAGESDILGLEVSGEVVQIHPEQSVSCSFKLGDKVFGLVGGGGYAEYVGVNAQHLMPIPKNLSMIQAAGIAECYLTAYQALFIENHLQPKQNVLIHAGASGVGLAAIQLAKKHDCFVAATASTQNKLNLCQQMGADLLINYQQQDFAQEISQQWPGCDFILDFVAGDYLNRNLQILKVDGHVLYLAMLAGRYADNLDMAMMLSKRATVKASTLRNRDEEYKSHLIKTFSQKYLAYFSQGKLIPNIDTHFPAQDIGMAHLRLEKNSTMGKMIGCW